MASRQDLDNWKELGNDGWSFDEVAPYYRKFEKYNPSSKTLSAKINDKYVDPLLRGTDGPIQVSSLVLNQRSLTRYANGSVGFLL